MNNQISQKQVREQLEDTIMDDQFEEKFKSYNDYQKSVQDLRSKQKTFFERHRNW